MNNIVLHIVNTDNFSGLESVACDIITNVDSKYKGIYVTKNGPIVEILKEKNIPYEIIQKVSIGEIKRIVKKYNPKIIHAHDFTASCICAFSNINVPIISHLHNNSPWLKKMHPYSFAYLLASLKFKKILIVSSSIKEEYVFSKFIGKKFRNIGNPISRYKILNLVDTDAYKKKYDICCVARLTDQKDPIKFLKVVEELKYKFPNIKVIWIGDGELKENIESEIKKMGLEKNLRLLGFLKNPYKLMASSKIFLLTSKYEGFGLVAFEALTLGLPCIVSNVGGLPNIVDESCGSLCNKDSDYVNSIIELLNNEKVMQFKHQNALKKASHIDNTNSYYKNISAIYDEICFKK